MQTEPPTTPTIARSPRVFYGWWIILGGMAGMVIQNGFNFHGINAFLIPLSTTFGVSLTAVAAIISLARIESAFIGPLEGYLVDRFGPRTMMLIGVPILGTGFILVSFAPSFPIFVATFIFGVVLGGSLGFHSPITTAVANWWTRKRGRAFGILWLGQSAGSAVVPVIAWLIDTYGWRVAFRGMGVVVFVIGLPVASLMRHRPEQYGLRPDGDLEPVQGSQATEGAVTDGETDFTVWEALRTPTFWYFVIAIGVRVSVTTAVAINSFNLVDSLGGTSTQAGLLFLMQGLLSAPGRLFLSWAGDSVNKRHIMAVSLAVLAASLLLMSQVTSVSQLMLVWVPYCAAWGGLTVLPHSLRADLFGRRNFATIQGAMSPIQLPFSALAPIFAAWMFERTGSYETPFLVFGGLTLLSMVLIMQARPVARPSPKVRSGGAR
jgi:sugar phosphate permease